MKVSTPYLKRLTFAIIAVSTIFLPGQLLAQCENCIKKNSATESPEEKEASNKICEKLKSDMANTSLDNPEDSTTKRDDRLGSYVQTRLDRHSKTTVACFQAEYIKLLETDPYPQLRGSAAQGLAYPQFKGEAVLNALTKALDDPSILVRIFAASGLTHKKYQDSTYSIDPRVEKILRDAAIGKDRNNWNLKGFYTKEEFSKDSEGTVEKWRDIAQQAAVSALISYKGESKASNLIDSVAKNGSTKELRNNAEKGKKYWDRH